MPKILKISLKNYQSHKDTEVDLSKGFNCFYGGSDNGKSSIIRALSSVLFRDKFYMRTGEVNGSVEITMDAITLSRHKSIKDNNVSEKFVLGSTVFRKIGKQLPEEITNATKMKPIELTDGTLVNLNLQAQHAGKFLLSDSESLRARITSLAASEVLDKASMEAAREHREVKSTLTFLADRRLHEVDMSLQEYKELPSQLDQLKDLINNRRSLEELSLKLNQLKDLNNKLKELESRNDVNYSMALVYGTDVFYTLTLLRLLNDYKKLNKKSFVIVLPRISSIVKNKDELEILRRYRNVLHEECKSFVKCLEISANKANVEDELTEFLLEIKQCPLCRRNT